MDILGKEVLDLPRNPEIRNAIHEVLDAVASGVEHPEREVRSRSDKGVVTTVSVMESRPNEESAAA